MATFQTRRLCPYCGESILLADCPIVTASVAVEGRLKRLMDTGEWIGPAQVPVQRHTIGADSPVGAEVDRFGGPTSADSGRWVLRSRSDDKARMVIAAPPSRDALPEVHQSAIGRIVAPKAARTLPTVQQAVRDVPLNSLRPRRACANCHHPLPVALDERSSAVIAVAGIVAASKSTMMARLCRIHEDQSSEVRSFCDLGFSEFVEMEGSPTALGEMAAKLRRGEEVGQTPIPGTRFYEPWMFQVAGVRANLPYLLFMHDVAGETLQDPELRDEQAYFLRWVDGLIFIVDPEPYLYPDAPSERKRVNQATLLQGIMEDIEGTTAPLSIVLAKADMLGLTTAPREDEHAEVQEILVKINAAAIVEAAGVRPGTTFHLMAAQPKVEIPPFGVAEVFSSVCKRCNLI